MPSFLILIMLFFILTVIMWQFLNLVAYHLYPFSRHLHPTIYFLIFLSYWDSLHFGTSANLVVFLRKPSSLTDNLLLSGTRSKEGGRKGIKLFRNLKLLRQLINFQLNKFMTSTVSISRKTCSIYLNDGSHNTFTALECINNRVMNNSENTIMPFYWSIIHLHIELCYPAYPIS